MAFSYARGDFAFLLWQPVGGAAVTLCITSHNLDISVLTYETISTCSGGLMARLVGRTDAKGTVNADLDLNAPPYLAPQSIIPGLSGILVFGLAPGRGIQVPILIPKIHYEAAVQDKVKYSWDAELNSNIGQLVYPAI